MSRRIMSWSDDQRAELKRRKADGEQGARIARAMGLTLGQVNTQWQRMSAAPDFDTDAIRAAAKSPDAGSTKVHVTDGGMAASVTTLTHEPVRTLEDLIRVCQIDVGVWEIVEWTANTWEAAAKGDDGKMHAKTLYQVKARLRRVLINPAVVSRGIIQALKRRVKPLRPVVRAAPVQSGYLYVATFGELHLGKLAHAPETGEDYDIRIASERLRESHRHLMTRARALNPERVALIIGDDFFTADNPQNTTTAGTPQEVDGRYKKVFRLGVSLCREIIEGWRQIAPVSVWIKRGNHDDTVTWHAGELLAAIYNDSPDVEVVHPDRLRHYQRWGTCLIGLTHGDKEKDEKLPLLMAHEAKDDWAATTCRVWLTGHLHTLKAKSSRAVVQPLSSDVHEEMGVTIRRCRSLSGTDAWHFALGYVGNLKAAEGFAFHRLLGETDIHTGVVQAAA